MELLKFLRDNWAVVEQAPWVFVFGAALSGWLGYNISARLTGERLQLAEDRVADYKEKLEGKSPDEAHAQIAELREELAKLASYGLSNEAQQKLRSSLIGASGKINILKNSDASDADRLYRQVVSTFRSVGLSVRSHAIMGISDAPDSGVTLVYWSATDQKLVTQVRQALRLAGLDARELVDPSDWGAETDLTLVFSSRDPDWVPAARWS